MSTGRGSSESDDSDSTNYQFNLQDVIDSFFPYEEPYENQKQGIRNTLNAFREGNFHLIEGPCGTGKTLIALNAAMGAVRDPKTNFNRVFIVTSVKQQQKAFEDDIKTINKYIEDKYGHKRKAPKRKSPIDSLTIVGKGDLCPYVDSGALDNESISGECSNLQTSTYDVANRMSPSNSISSGANNIIEAGRLTKQESSTESVKRSKDIPVFENIDEGRFPASPLTEFDKPACPFYAQALIDEEKGTQTVQYSGMMDASNLRNKASKLGTCPYEVMSDGIEEAEVIIGNYAHAFDRQTIQATTQLIHSEDTLLVVDEAHMLVERARDQLGATITRSDITHAINAIEVMDDNKHLINGEVMDEVKKELRQAGSSLEGARNYKKFFKRLRDFIDEISTAFCNRQEEQNEYLSDDESIPLRSPDSTTPGQLLSWMEQEPFSERFYQLAEYRTRGIESAITKILNELDENYPTINTNSIKSLGSFISKKSHSSPPEYFTKIRLTGEGENWSYNPTKKANQNYTIEVSLENCIPANDLSRHFSEFGGGLVMSATLSPTDVTSKIIGIEQLESGYTSDEFNLNFPKENRRSFVVDHDKFTSNNRGDPNDENSIRKQYKTTIKNVIEDTEGNTLICMPSYDEASWIGNYLRMNLDIPVFIDESSSNDETTAMKTEFTTKKKAVLTTSLRGTLTEGVDYSGSDLSNVIVVGVPLTNPTSSIAKAIRNAFTLKFGGSNAFTYSFTLPAIFKTRQALGRVIRSSDDTGIRILMDERYKSGHREHKLLTNQQQEEYSVVNEVELLESVNTFWESNTVN